MAHSLVKLMPHKKIGFITSSAELLSEYFPTRAEPDFIPTEPPFTPDDHSAVMELRKAGLAVEPIVWGADINTVSKYQLLVIRSPWDYMDSPEKTTDFLNWLGVLEENNINIENKIPFIRWLYDKRYLKDIESQNVKIVPTRVIEKNTSLTILNIYKKEGPIIFKPCISAAGKGLYFINSEIEAIKQQDIIQKAINEKDYLIQPYIKEIKTAGEWSLIFFNGEYSHSVLKNTARDTIFVHAELGGSVNFLEPPAETILTGQVIYKKLIKAFHATLYFTSSSIPKDWHPLYIRLDIIPAGNELYLSECEGFEPELFFRAKEGSEKVFAKHICQNLSII